MAVQRINMDIPKINFDYLILFGLSFQFDTASNLDKFSTSIKFILNVICLTINYFSTLND